MPKQIPDERVFTAAVTVMAQQGYAGATTRQIAEEAGINEVTLFRRFASKANLLRAALLAELESFQSTELEYTGDVAVDLRRVVVAYQRLLERRGRLIPVLLSEASRQDELKEVLAIPRELLGKVGALLLRYQSEGVLRREPPLQAVAALVAPLLLPALLGANLPDAALSQPIDAQAHVNAYLHGHSKGDTP